jgi:hypothetical protein
VFCVFNPPPGCSIPCCQKGPVQTARDPANQVCVESVSVREMSFWMILSQRSALLSAIFVVPSSRQIGDPVSIVWLVPALSRASTATVDAIAFQPLIPVAAKPRLFT